MNQPSKAMKRHRQKGDGTLSSAAVGFIPDQTDPPANTSLKEAISQAAYLLAESRGFEPGHEIEDWLAAEQDIVGTRSTSSN
jgi:hypothetical protein